MKSILLGVVLLAAALGVYLWWSMVQAPPVAITSFEECVAAGNPIMESYPRKCRDPHSGTLYVEDTEPVVEDESESTVFVTEQGNNDIISVDTPEAGDIVTSPLAIAGEARGTWYFEASFPIELVDSKGATIATHYATAEGDWMTEEYVPFTASLEFTVPAGETSGTLILRRDNPSGLPEHDDQLTIPVQFGTPTDEADLEVM